MNIYSKFVIIVMFLLVSGETLFSQSGNPAYSTDLSIRLLEAASYGDYPVVAECLKKGVDVNTETWEGVTALMYATAMGHKSMVKLLLEKGAKVNAQPYNGLTALITASQYGFTEIAEILLADSADVNLAGHNKATPLHYASLYNNDTIAFMLLAAGANPNKLTDDKVSPLSMASMNGSYESAYLLVDAGANLNSQDESGFTPLMFASQNGYLPLVELLLNNQADINLQNNKGYSALSLAIVNKHRDIVNYLIQHGANVKEVNSININARVLANISGDTAILDTIKKARVKVNLFPVFKSMGGGIEACFNKKDFITGIFISQFDLKYGLTYNFGFSLRPSAIQIRQIIPEYGYYQFMERRYLFNFDLTKGFSFHPDNQSIAGINLGGSLLYTFGKYRGTNIPINGGFRVAPKAWVFYRKHNFETRFGYHYTNYGEKELSKSHFTISLMYHFYNFNFQNLNRKLKWID